MSGFGSMEMWSYGIWAYWLLPISEYLSLIFWSRHGDKFVHSSTLLIDISLRWFWVCLLLDKMNTWFFHRSHFLLIISLYMITTTIMLLFWYNPLQRVQINQRMILYMKRWLILWEMIFWRQCNEKMVRYMMTLIIAMGTNTKWTMTLNICLMILGKIIEINYTYVSLKHPMARNILWRVTILFIYQRISDRGGLSRSKGIWPEGKNILQRKLGHIF